MDSASGCHGEQQSMLGPCCGGGGGNPKTWEGHASAIGSGEIAVGDRRSRSICQIDLAPNQSCGEASDVDPSIPPAET